MFLIKYETGPGQSKASKGPPNLWAGGDKELEPKPQLRLAMKPVKSGPTFFKPGIQFRSGRHG